MKNSILVFGLLLICSINLAISEETGDAIEQSKRAVCPGNGNCNGHGICNNGICTCTTGWQGNDCSLVVKPLQPNTPLAGQSVNTRQWIFYTIPTTQGNGLIVGLNQTTSGGDIDVYLLIDDIPTRTKYKYRDISQDKNFQIIIDNAGSGTWYIGVYGYLASTFTITASVSGNLCANLSGCHAPNGVCVSAGKCRCNDGWSGADCSIKLNQITLGTTYSGAVGNKQWSYYTTQILHNNNLRIDVSQTGDVDVYVKYGNTLPTVTTYDYRDTSRKDNFTMLINEPNLGTWYFGFYGYQPANYTFTVSTNNECPSKCSLHGTCRGAQCQCDSGYSGVYCQNKLSDLINGVTVNGYVDDNSWNYYTFTANTETNMVITVNETNNGDCDIYVKQGSQPTKFSYDYKNIGTGSLSTITVPSAVGQFNIGIYGYSTCSYQITVIVSAQCPGNPPCSGHGECSDGQCDCDVGFTGQNCSLALTTIPNGGSVSSSVNLNSWTFFALNLQNSSSLSISLKEINTIGNLWLYVSKGRMPDSRNFDYSLLETINQYHHLNIVLQNQQTDSYVIGVYANPFATNGPIPFTLVAWYSPY